MSPAVFLQSVQKKYESSDGLLLNRIPALSAGRFLKPAGTGRDGIEPMPHPAAVRDISFSVPEGQIFGILGPVDSGKTTLIRLIAGLLQPDTGRVEVFGYDLIRHTDKLRHLINRVASDGSFFRKRSVLDNLLNGDHANGKTNETARRQAVELLGKLGLDEDTIHQPMENVSPGALQLVSLARAILSGPRLLLLDEPTTGLTPLERQAVWSVLKELRREGVTILVATEDPEEARQLCDRLIVLEDGRIVAEGAPEEVLCLNPEAAFLTADALSGFSVRMNPFFRPAPGSGYQTCTGPLSLECEPYRLAAARMPTADGLKEPN